MQNSECSKLFYITLIVCLSTAALILLKIFHRLYLNIHLVTYL